MTTPNTPAPSSIHDEYDMYVCNNGDLYYVIAFAERVGHRDEGMWVERYEVYDSDDCDAQRVPSLETDDKFGQAVRNEVNSRFFASYERP